MLLKTAKVLDITYFYIEDFSINFTKKWKNNDK